MSGPVSRGWLGGLLAWLIAHGLAIGAEPDGVAFFEQRIRPVLVKECYSCHSAESKKLKGGLRLDTRAGVLKGGDSGPAVVPGKPDESPLLEAVRHEGIAMPPNGKLPEPVIADFEHWIAIGAPDPREGATVTTRPGIDVEAGRRHWAYQPPRPHQPPPVTNRGWATTKIDRFVLAGLESRGLSPVADADRATLVRRLYFDLTGLPPSPAEIDAFLDDASSTAYASLVDRLLASPRFGERWGRHWLDVVRFAESLTLRGFVLKESWRYRDYVIDAFNNDMPFDQFLREQVAGDLMPSSGLDDRRRKMIAATFLTLGDTNLEEQDKAQLDMDVVDEQIDTIGKAYLAQTIACARCHDHKFDPIPTRDYYAIAGILRNARLLEHANVSQWLEHPLPNPPDIEAVLQVQEARVAALEAKIKAERGRLAKSKGSSASGVIAIEGLVGVVVDDSRAKRVGEWMESQFSGSYIGKGYLHDKNEGKGEKTLTFQPDLPEAGQYEVWLAYSSGTSRSSAVPVTIFSADGERTLEIDMKATPPINGRFASLGRYRFERSGQGFVLISNEGTKGHVTADAALFIPVDQIARAVAPGSKPAAGETQSLPRLEAELKRVKAEGPRRDRVMSVEELAPIVETRVHIRGSVHTLGEPVSRGFLSVATSGKPCPMPSNESGRRELADWLTSRENPLTARVFVNRAWHWLFGAGIVRTTDNFGTTGEKPSHPELLDELAVEFMNEGWSVKTLVRRIVLSHAYRLSAAESPRQSAADPENRYLWRSNRRRLDAECIRDAILAASGRLNLAMRGPSYPVDLAADFGFKHEDTRRSVYSPVFRNALPELFEVFDFADPGMVVGRRNVSAVAPQALFLLNHPFVIEQSRAAASRLTGEPGLDDDARIERAYRQTLGRSPTNEERAICRRFLGTDAGLDSWALLFQTLFASSEFRYVN